MSILNYYSENPYDFEVIENSEKFDDNFLKETVISMLNSRGGLIFFDCTKKLCSVTCVGVKHNELDKERLEQRIGSYL